MSAVIRARRRSGSTGGTAAPTSSLAATSLKWRNLLARPYASLCVDQRTPPYSAVVLDGPVEAVEDPARLCELVGRMADSYYGAARGAAFAERYRDNPSTVLFRLRPERTASWAYREDE